MRFLFLVFLIVSTAGLHAQSKLFLLEFDSLIKKEEPEKAEKLLIKNMKSIKEEQLRMLRTSLGESYFKNAIFDKALEHYRLSGNLKQNSSLYYYDLALKEPPISLKNKKKYYKKADIDEVLARYLRTFLRDQKKMEAYHILYNKALQFRIERFIYRRRPDRAEKYLIANLPYISETMIKEYSYHIGTAFMKSFEYRNYNKALKYIKESGRLDEYPVLKNYARGMMHQKRGEFHDALEYFKKGGFRRNSAWMHGEIGKKLVKSGNLSRAKINYKKALDIYHEILFTIDIPWTPADSKRRLEYDYALFNFKQSEKELKDNRLIQKILKGCGNYCRTLNDFSIYYYCQEKVYELARYSMVSHLQSKLRLINSDYGKKNFNRDKKTRMTYDYQIIKENGAIQETRTALFKTKKTKNNLWATETIQVMNFFYGPVGLFHTDMQNLYSYRLYDRNGKACKRDAWVLDIVPEKPGSKLIGSNKILMYGRVWIDKRDFSVLRVSWIPKFGLRTRVLTAVSELLGHKPSIEFITDFNVKKGVLRYPSGGFYREHFMTDKGKKLNFTDIDIKFLRYRFFNTATKIKQEKIGGRL